MGRSLGPTGTDPVTIYDKLLPDMVGKGVNMGTDLNQDKVRSWKKNIMKKLSLGQGLGQNEKYMLDQHIQKNIPTFEVFSDKPKEMGGHTMLTLG